MIPLGAAERTALRMALLQCYPWVADDVVGPGAVEAGECDRCRVEPRLVTTCGPTAWAALGRRCALQVGVEAWCDGHVPEGKSWLAALRGLPAEADAVARLWWVATGEVRLDVSVIEPLRRRALPG